MSIIRLYRMVHIQNIKHILQHGITHASSINANPQYVPIGDNALINHRHTTPTPYNTVLGQYTPFYFGVRMPMLYVLQKGFNGVIPIQPENIVYCVSNVQKMVTLNVDFIFTNGHAVDALSNFFSSTQWQEIPQKIDFTAVNAKFWKEESDLDLKRRKEAEFLVLGDIPIDAISGYVVYNKTAQQNLLQLGISAEKIHIEPNFYF